MPSWLMPEMPPCIHHLLYLAVRSQANLTIIMQDDTRSVEGSTAPPSQLTGMSAAGITPSGAGSNLQTVGDSMELTVVASTAGAPEALPATAGPASDSQAASALKVWTPHLTCPFIRDVPTSR